MEHRISLLIEKENFEQASSTLRRTLRSGKAMMVDYQPGNGSRLVLTFIPDTVVFDPDRPKNVIPTATYVLVAWTNIKHRAHWFRLERTATSYVQEKLDLYDYRSDCEEIAKLISALGRRGPSND